MTKENKQRKFETLALHVGQELEWQHFFGHIP